MAEVGTPVESHQAALVAAVGLITTQPFAKSVLRLIWHFVVCHLLACQRLPSLPWIITCCCYRIDVWALMQPRQTVPCRSHTSTCIWQSADVMSVQVHKSSPAWTFMEELRRSRSQRVHVLINWHVCSLLLEFMGVEGLHVEVWVPEQVAPTCLRYDIYSWISGLWGQMGSSGCSAVNFVTGSWMASRQLLAPEGIQLFFFFHLEAHRKLQQGTRNLQPVWKLVLRTVNC